MKALRIMRDTGLLIIAALLCVFPSVASAQTSLTATTLADALTTASFTTVHLTSATNVTAGNTLIYVDKEAMYVTAVNGSYVNVVRGADGTQAVPHASGAGVLLGPSNAFQAYDPSGSCTASNVLYTPWVNVNNGRQWLCSSVTGEWVPGFGNTAAPAQPTAAVASAAGKVTPSGPLFHVTGTAAITGFNIPVGFDPVSGSQICAIPDGLWTTTNANNLAIASTAVVSKTLCWTYDGNTAKFYPSY